MRNQARRADINIENEDMLRKPRRGGIRKTAMTKNDDSVLQYECATPDRTASRQE